jgi:hypothetical protein
MGKHIISICQGRQATGSDFTRQTEALASASGSIRSKKIDASNRADCTLGCIEEEEEDEEEEKEEEEEEDAFGWISKINVYSSYSTLL